MLIKQYFLAEIAIDVSVWYYLQNYILIRLAIRKIGLNISYRNSTLRK